MNLEVKVQMIKKKIKQIDIAKKLGVKPCTVAGVVNGHRESRRIKQAIADAVGITFEKLWGKGG